MDVEVGARHRLHYVVPESKTVPHVYEDAEEFAVMPRVFATAFLVGLLERACVELLLDHLDWPREMTVGTHVDVSHTAPTPPGRTVTVEVELVEVEGRRLVFEVTAHDGVAEISRGRHERHLIDADRFRERLGL